MASSERPRRHCGNSDDDAGVRSGAADASERARAARLRRQPRPGKIVAAVMHLPHVTGREDHELGLLLRWTYGSGLGIAHGAPHHRPREPSASAVFGGILMSATLSLFPLLGHTPPPWRWQRGMLATSVATHVAYVAAVATADDAVLPPPLGAGPC